jgi:hypothetical protein
MGVIRDGQYGACHALYASRVRVERRTPLAEDSSAGAYPAGAARRLSLLDHEPHAKAYDCAHFQPERQ